MKMIWGLSIAIILLVTSGCVHYVPPPSRPAYESTTVPASRQRVFDALVSVAMQLGAPIQASDSGAGLLRLGPVLVTPMQADCGRFSADVDQVRLSQPSATFTLFVEPAGEGTRVRASAQIAQVVYQMGRSWTWQPTHLLACHSTNDLEEKMVVLAREKLGLTLR